MPKHTKEILKITVKVFKREKFLKIILKNVCVRSCVNTHLTGNRHLSMH